MRNANYESQLTIGLSSTENGKHVTRSSMRMSNMSPIYVPKMPSDHVLDKTNTAPVRPSTTANALTANSDVSSSCSAGWA